MDIKRDLYIPIYVQISNDIRSMILNDYYKEGDKILTEAEISEKYNVSRMTARSSVTELVKIGVVFRVHGKGAYVSRRKVERNLNKITGFHEDILLMGLKPSSKIITFDKRYPTEKECHHLNIGKLNDVYEIKRIRYVDDIPYGYQELIVPVYLVPDLERLDLEKKSLYSYFKKVDKELSTAEQRMEAVLNEKVSKITGINKNIPFFYFERVSYLEDKTPIEILHSYFRGDKFSYTISLSNK